jgi:DDE domain
LLRAAPFWGRVGRPLARPLSTKPKIPDVAAILPEAVATAPRDKAVALKLLERILKRSGQPRRIVTDGLWSYSASMKELDNADRQEVGDRLNNRAENSQQPFRRREWAMQRFRRPKTLQKLSSVHARSTPCSIRSAISSRGRSTSRDARPRWRSGAHSCRRSPLAGEQVAQRADAAVTLTKPLRLCVGP